MRDDGKPQTIDVLGAFIEYQDGGREHDDAPVHRWPGWEGVVIKLAEDLARRGLIDYGVSATYGWPTGKGREHYAKVNRRGVVDEGRGRF